MNVVGKVSSFFHPFGGAVDIIVVKQQDGIFRSTPWYVRFGKFQGFLKGAEKVVRIEVNGVEADFHMHLDNAGEAYFVREDNSDKGERNEDLKDSDTLEGTPTESNVPDHSINVSTLTDDSLHREEAADLDNGEVEVRDERVTLGMDRLERTESDIDRTFYEFQDEQSSQEGSNELSEYGSSRYDNLDSVEHVIEMENMDSEVVLVSIDGHIMTAPISSSESDTENVQPNTPQFHIAVDKGTEYNKGESAGNDGCFCDQDTSMYKVTSGSECDIKKCSLASKYEPEPGEVDAENLHHMRETQDAAHGDRDLCPDCYLEKASSSFKRDGEFKSCLELSKLAVKSINADQQNTTSSLEISKAAEDSQEHSPQNPMGNDKGEELNLQISKSDNGQHSHEYSPQNPMEDAQSEEVNLQKSNGNGLPPSDSKYTSNVSLQQSQVEVADHANDAFDMDHMDSDSTAAPINVLDSEKQIGTDAAADRMQSVKQAMAFMYEEVNLQKSSGNGLSPSDSKYTSNVPLRQSQVEIADHAKDAFDMDHMDSDSTAAPINDLDSEKQIGTDVAADGMQSVKQGMVFMDEEVNLQKSGGNGLSPSDSKYTSNVSLQQSQVEVADHAKDAFDMDHMESDNAAAPINGLDSEKQIGTDVAADGMQSVNQGMTFMDEEQSQVEVADHAEDAFDMDHMDSDSMAASNSEKQIGTDVAANGMQSVKQAIIFMDECSKTKNVDLDTRLPNADISADMEETRYEISLCGNLLYAGMGSDAAAEAFDTNRISAEDFKSSAASIVSNENLIVRIKGDYLPWDKAAHITLGMAAYGLNLPVQPGDAIPLEEGTPETKEDNSGLTSTASGRRWSLWPLTFRKDKTLEHSGSNSSTEEIFVDSESVSTGQPVEQTSTPRGTSESPRKQLIRTNLPTTDQIASLNLNEGRNIVNFIFSTSFLGAQKVEAHIYLWKWDTHIVISDVDGTITKSDVLGQVMPLVGKDWTHSGIARLFSAIKENGYQLLFLSARAIVQSYLTKNFLFNLKQDGKSLPAGPVVISPDGLFPSLYREVIRRAPHEFKIACLEDIKALFPTDHNPFYAGFGNRDTDEFSYQKIGIPKSRIFIINPKGEIAINHGVDVKLTTYTSLHTLVDNMFPSTLVEQDDFNSWNYWKMALPPIDDL